MRAHGISVKGTRVGKAENQDAFWCDEQDRLFVVSDGVGGIDAGQMAAFLFVWGVVEQFAAGRRHPRAVADGLHWAQGKMIEHVRRRALGKMGACGSVVWLGELEKVGTLVQIVHIGDTRVVCVHEDGRVERYTTVHHGRTPAPENRAFLDRYVGNRTGEDYGEYAVKYAPSGSWLLLMSDGVAEVLEDEDLVAVIRDFGAYGPYEVANRLISLSQAYHATDDLTVVAIHLD